jgi:50S ribosomal subunit-associated GTPase HflX
MPVAPDVSGNIRAVREVLEEIGAGEVPELLAFNKSDLAPATAVRLVEGTRARWRSAPRPATVWSGCWPRSATGCVR